MIVKKLSDIEKSDRHVIDPHGNWTSSRIVLAKENVGFSFHITKIKAGADFEMHYQNHFECVYCIRGKGEIIDLSTNETHTILPGTMYLLNNHDKHRLRAFSELEVACVFNPPITGNEVHNEDGSYELVQE